MVRARTVLLILVLLAGSLSPPGLSAQASSDMRQAAEESRSFVIEQNYPDPVNPETWIPIYLPPSLFEKERPVTMTMRIYNILSQAVAVPEAIDHPSGRGTRVIDLAFSEPGRKIAYWDGKDQSGRSVPSGVYYLQVVVGEETQTRKLVVLNPRRRRSIFPW
jgi:hypothetical protein